MLTEILLHLNNQKAYMQINDTFTTPKERRVQKCRFRIKSIDAKGTVVAIDENANPNPWADDVHTYPACAMEILEAQGKLVWKILDGQPVDEMAGAAANVERTMAALEFIGENERIPLDVGIEGMRI